MISDQSWVPPEEPEGHECLSWPCVALFHRPTLTLEERELSLKSLEENNQAWIKHVSQLHSALHKSEQLLSDRIGELQELNTQVTCALVSSSPGMDNCTCSSRDTQLHLQLQPGAPSCFPLPAASTAAVLCPVLLLHPEAKAGSGVS